MVPDAFALRGRKHSTLASSTNSYITILTGKHFERSNDGVTNCMPLHFPVQLAF